MLKRFILWDFPRASWQYDVMVGIILAFIFLTPREWFRDQPRIPNTSSIAMWTSEDGSLAFFVDRELLDGIPENQRVERLTPELRRRTSNRSWRDARGADSQFGGELQGYLASARP